MFPRICKKLVPLLLIVSFLVPSVLLLYPQKTYGQATSCLSQISGALGASKIISKIFKPVPTADNTTQLTTGGSFVVNCILTPLAIQLARAMLQNITSGVVNWINNGFKSDGNPIFAQDLRGMLRDTADQVIGSFIEKDLGAGFLCNSFSFQVKLALAQSYMPYRQRSSCTLSQITNNANNFANNNGGVGWDRWLQVTTVPQNNVYGATVLAQDELSKKIFDAQKIQSQYLDWGKGFRSWQECEETSDGSDPSKADPNDPNICVQIRTNTPGGVVQDQLSASLQSDMSRLEVAKDIDAIVGALTNQLMSQVVSGAQGLLGAGDKSKKSSAVSYQSAINPITEDPALLNAVNAGLSYSSTESSNLFTPGDTVTVDQPVDTTDPQTGEVVVTVPEPPVIAWAVTENSTPVNINTPFTYGLALSSNYATTSLSVTMSFKKGDGTAARFTDVFVTPQITAGRADTSKATRYVDNTAGASWTSVSWAGVSAAKNTDFTFKFLGWKKDTAKTGLYSLETSVYDSKGRLVKTQTSNFVVQ